MKTVTFAMVIFLCAGCANLRTRPIDTNKWAKDYYNQPRLQVVDFISGAKSITIEAADGQTVAISGPVVLPPLSVIPRDPTLLEKAGDVVVKLGGLATGAYLGGKGIDGLSSTPRTVEPSVVQPVIVEKEVLVK